MFGILFEYIVQGSYFNRFVNVVYEFLFYIVGYVVRYDIGSECDNRNVFFQLSDVLLSLLFVYFRYMNVYQYDIEVFMFYCIDGFYIIFNQCNICVSFI